MKKIIIPIFIILFISSFFLFNHENFNIICTSAIDAITTYDTFIPYNLIKQYESNNEVKRKEAETEIKKICLNALEYSNWENYLDYIDLKIYKANVLPENNEELIVALNLSKDLASVCVFVDNGQSYDFFEKIDDLLPVNNIGSIKIPDRNYNFLIIYQTADERLGAFFYENFLEIFMYDNDIFQKKLKETLFFEEIFKNIWVDENAPENEWTKNMIKNNIIFNENHNLFIEVLGTKNKYIASDSITIPKNNDFKLVDSTSYEYKYYWNKELLQFNRKDNIITFKDIPMVIVGDSETDCKNLCGFSKNKYKLMTTSGKIIYIDKEVIDNAMNE